MATIISEIENKYLDYIRTYGKEPTHLVLGKYEYKELLINLQAITRYECGHYHTYRGMKILVCESGRTLKPSVGILI